MTVPSQILYLSSGDISSLNVQMSDTIALLEEAFLENASGTVQALPKTELHPKNDENFINAMLCAFPKYQAAGIKWISAYPSNREKNLPYLSGLIVLNNPDNGIPFAVLDASIVTALRTGAVTGLSAKYLARKESKQVAIIGCGVQARTQLSAVTAVCRQVDKILAYDIIPERLHKFCIEMSERLQVELIPATSPKEAVVDSDIIITAGPILQNPQPVIEGSWLKEGCFGAPIDYDSYWQKSAFEAASRIYVDDVAQFDQHREYGYFSAVPQVFGDLSQLIGGQIPGRQTEQERIIAVNLGLSLEDIAVGAWVYKVAVANKIGTWLSR